MVATPFQKILSGRNSIAVLRAEQVAIRVPISLWLPGLNQLAENR
jgi:hypothetical protein